MRCSGALSCPADGPSVRYGPTGKPGPQPGPRVVHLMRQRSAGVLLGRMRWKSPIAGGGEGEGGVGTREVQVRAGPTSSAGESTRAKVRGGCTRALAPMGAPRCPGRCRPTTLVFSFSYPCQVLVRCLTFPQKRSLKAGVSHGCSGVSRRMAALLLQVLPGTSRERGDRQAGLSPRETPIFPAPSCPQLWNSVLLLVCCLWHLSDSSSLSRKTGRSIYILFSGLPSLFHSLPTKPR